MKYQSAYEGDVYKQKVGTAKVLTYHGTKNIDIEFIDTGTRLNVSAQQLKKGSIEDKMAPKLFGVGYHGFGVHLPSHKGKLTKPYTLWYDMLCRCYNTTLHKTKHSTYVGITVCKEWHNFQVFAEWLEKNYVKGWTLDKDLLGGSVYSPETCVYIPAEVNMAEAHLRKLSIFDNRFEELYDKFVEKALIIYQRSNL
jgi:hypothetical protein